MIVQRPISEEYFTTSLQSNVNNAEPTVDENLNQRVKQLEDYLTRDQEAKFPFKTLMIQGAVFVLMHSFNKIVIEKFITGKPKIIFLELSMVVSFFLVLSHLLEII